MKMKLLITSLIILIPLILFAQKQQREKPRLNDFGKSLIKKPDSKDLTKTSSTEQNSDDIIKVETNLVRLDVLVTDAKGNNISGLTPKDFIVTEDNVAQQIGTFSLGDDTEIPRSIVLIIDYSGSQIPFIGTSVEAAKVLVDKLNPKDKMAIVTDDVQLLTGFTRDKLLLKKSLDALFKKVKNGYFVESEFKNGVLGKSLQYSSLLASLNELFDSEDLRPIVIFQTDGDQFYNIKSSKPKEFQSLTSYEPDFSLEELFDRIERSNATIYSIISGLSLVGLSEEERFKKMSDATETLWKNGKLWKPGSIPFRKYVDRLSGEQNSLEYVAKLSGGFSQSLEEPKQAGSIYSRILNSINKRYLIGYYPVNQEHDGKRRNVKVEVKGHPEYIVLGRKFYYTSTQSK